MIALKELYNDMISAMGVDDLVIPVSAVKFFKNDDQIPPYVWEYHPEEINVTSCQTNKQASIGDAICLTRESIGCVAAAITFGLVDQYEKKPLGESRIYTDIMKSQSGLAEKFVPPTPKDFTEGIVYACQEAKRIDYCLFGDNDSGRFATQRIAQKAISEMMAIQPAIMRAVFIYSLDFVEMETEPDVIVMSVRPVELARIVQAYQFNTGKRVQASMGAVRVVNSDLIVRPYLTGEINISTYCIGARLIAKYEANRLGIGMPFSIFKSIVSSMKESKTGYPFHLYPGAAE